MYTISLGNYKQTKRYSKDIQTNSDIWEQRMRSREQMKEREDIIWEISNIIWEISIGEGQNCFIIRHHKFTFCPSITQPKNSESSGAWRVKSYRSNISNCLCHF